jgi:hypothetical protein
MSGHHFDSFWSWVHQPQPTKEVSHTAIPRNPELYNSIVGSQANDTDRVSLDGVEAYIMNPEMARNG